MDLLGAVTSYRAHFPLLRDALLLPAYLAYQFPLSLPLALIGARWLWRRDRAVLIGLLVLYLGNALLMLTRHHPGMYVRDQFLFYLASYLPVATLNWPRRSRTRGHGDLPATAAVAYSRGARRSSSDRCPDSHYPLAARFASEVTLRLAPARHLPGRDPVSFYLLPWKTGYHGAREFGRAALTGLPRDAVVVADWLPFHTLRYLQVIEGLRTDVTIAQLNAGDGVQLHYLLDQERGHPLYLADNSPLPYYERAAIERCFRIEPDGVLYRLERRQNRHPASHSDQWLGYRPPTANLTLAPEQAGVADSLTGIYHAVNTRLLYLDVRQSCGLCWPASRHRSVLPRRG